MQWPLHAAGGETTPPFDDAIEYQRKRDIG